MKISRNWLNHYIISKKTDDELVDSFTQLGLECTSDRINSIDSNIVVGKVVSCIKHPNADRLKICKVDICDDELLTIICGAPNIKKNILVPVAKIGSCLGDFKIKKTKIRDIVSYGMICSEKELGLSDEHEGIMVLNSKLEKGQELNIALSFKEDTVFDFDLTPNRGDCLGHIGVARELAIIEKSKSRIKNYEQKNLKVKKNNETLTIDIADNDKCRRYVACIIRNVKVKDSPNWLKVSLESIGQKSINNIVDAANFILMDLGHPMHTFDLAKIKSNSINVRVAKKNENIVTLDEYKQKLNSDNLLICDGNTPIAIAGIIGGNNSGVDKNTKDILIESAYFDPINIRKSSKSLGISTEASRRFERDTDINMLIPALNKLALLIQDVGGGEISSKFFDIYDNDFQSFDSNGLLFSHMLRTIFFNINKCNDFLGTNISLKEVKEIFNILSIDCKNKDGKLICIIPSFRNDLHRDVDLYEEVARVYGYDRIPSNLNFKFSSSSLITDNNVIEDKIRNILSNNGFNEHYSNSLYSEKETLFSNNKPIKIINPLSKDMEFVRNSLVPGMLKTLSYNEKRKCDFLKYYEIGSINVLSDKKYNSATENRGLCLGYLGSEIVSWKGKQSFSIYDVKGDLSMLIHNLGLNNINYKVESDSNESNFNLSILIGKNKIGNIIGLDNKIKKEYDISSDIIICNIDFNQLKTLYDKMKIMYKKIVPYPSINRDIAILVHSDVKHSQIVATIFESGSNLLKEVNLFDIYEDENLNKNTKSMAYSLEFQSSDRTLTIKEIDREMILIIKNLKTKLKAKQR